MKSVACLLITALPVMASMAQGVFNNQTNMALQKVIEDFPNKFRDIRGNRLSGNSQWVSYQSKVAIPGARKVVIVQEGSARRESYTWKCELYASGDFAEVKQKFRELFGNIKNSIIKIEGQQPFILNGKYETPSEEQNNTSILFQLLPSTGVLQHLKVELAMRQVAGDWTITLKVYEQPGSELAQSE